MLKLVWNRDAPARKKKVEEITNIQLPETTAAELEKQLNLWFEDAGFKHLIPDSALPFALGLEELLEALKNRTKVGK